MDTVLLKVSHEDMFLETGFLLLLQFFEGFAPFRITGKQWSNLEPWPLGAVAARGNLAQWNSVQDQNQKYILEPWQNNIMFHTFWGVTPTRARVFTQFPAQMDLGSMQQTPRAINPTTATASGDIGYIDGEKSPFWVLSPKRPRSSRLRRGTRSSTCITRCTTPCTTLCSTSTRCSTPTRSSPTGR